jgi:hypothetical protein
MADKMSKDEGTLPKLGPSKPPQKNRADLGKSPQELRGSVKSYVGDEPVPDPEDAGFAPEAQGAMAYLDSNYRVVFIPDCFSSDSTLVRATVPLWAANPIVVKGLRLRSV